MIDAIQSSLNAVITRLVDQGVLPEAPGRPARVERTRDATHGDYATNLALTLARQAGCRPRDLAERIVADLEPPGFVARVEIAGPGFINFHVRGGRWSEVLSALLEQGAAYGTNTVDNPQRVHIEFVSANPTGPLHVGHGRGAAYGASMANILAAVGHQVHREYYVNDMGRQMDILALSVWLRGLGAAAGMPFPDNAYQGDYVRDIAATARTRLPQAFADDCAETLGAAAATEDPEARLDALIAGARERLGEAAFLDIQNLALRAILEDIRADLAEFGVHYDLWFSERSLGESGRIREELERLASRDFSYEMDGALWFRATRFGDEKDRVLRRDNGLTTYFASDVAYHLDKFERNFELCINVWGADHHGYVPRVQAALDALDLDSRCLRVHLVQFANLYRGGEKVAMSTRSGSFVTLRELRGEVGNDAARFFYVMRKSDQHMDFDLDLARSQSKDNPVYYIQYAHARVCSMLARLQERGSTWDRAHALESLDLLTEEAEQDILARLEAWPDTLSRAAGQAAPHVVANYLRELANRFHVYYNAHRVLVDDDRLRDARVALSLGVRQVIANGLNLLGVSAPESM